jgi:3-deoxy-7-phosphoheptulonate synthase
MIIVMEPDAADAAIAQVIAQLVGAGFDVHRSRGQTRTILGVVGDVTSNDIAVVRELEAVAKVVRVTEPYRLASRRFRQDPTVVEGAWGTIGGERPWIAIEPVGLTRDEIRQNDDELGGPGSTELPYEVAAGRPFDAAVTRRRVAPESIGALACLSLHRQPADRRYAVLFVERAPSWGANAWIGAADRALERREGSVVLLEAGGEYPSGARTLEIAAIARAKQRTHLPIVVDVPSIAQRARYCAAVAGAAIGAGADGIVLRVWAGREGEPPRLPATLRWSEAVELADRVRAIGAAVRR